MENGGQIVDMKNTYKKYKKLIVKERIQRGKKLCQKLLFFILKLELPQI